MADLLYSLLIFIVGLFAGGVFMQLIVDHPARLKSTPASAIEQMQRVLKRADPYMPILSNLGFVVGLICYYYTRLPEALIAALALGFMMPFTIFAILPINKTIGNYPQNGKSEQEILGLMHTWTGRHGVRAVGALIALTAMSFGHLFLR